MSDHLFKRKKHLYFALVIADRPTDGFTFKADADCAMFMVTGETSPRVVIPPTLLKEVVDRFHKPSEVLKAKDEIRISERNI